MSASAQLTTSINGICRIQGEGTVLGHAYVFGVLHHAWLVQVVEASGEQVAVNDPHHRLDDVHYLAGDGGPFDTVEVPGFPGRYAFVIPPAVR